MLKRGRIVSLSTTAALLEQFGGRSLEDAFVEIMKDDPQNEETVL